jgi:hypothetical protein
MKRRLPKLRCEEQNEIEGVKEREIGRESIETEGGKDKYACDIT